MAPRLKVGYLPSGEGTYLHLATPIDSNDRLAAAVVLSQTSESEILDFKASIDLRRANESASKTTQDNAIAIARDIAAFANTRGGSIVIGVAEAPNTSTANAWVNVSNVDDLVRFVTSTVSNYLVPSTLGYTTARLCSPDNTCVLVVNVPAHDRGVVAVWKRGATKGIEYPFRTSFGNEYMNPDQAAERIMNASRPLELRLRSLHDERARMRVHSQVLVGDGVQRRRILAVEGSGPPYPGWKSLPRSQARITRLGEHEFELSFEVGSNPDLGHSVRVAIPYGALVEVWRMDSFLVGLILRYTIYLPVNPLVDGFISLGDAPDVYR